VTRDRRNDQGQHCTAERDSAELPTSTPYRAHAAEEQPVTAVAGTEREGVDVDAMVDHRGDADAARARSVML